MLSREAWWEGRAGNGTEFLANEYVPEGGADCTASMRDDGPNCSDTPQLATRILQLISGAWLGLILEL